MESISQLQVERTKDNFDLALLLEARKRSLHAMNRIAKAMQPGMTEEEGMELAKAMLCEMGAEKNWHRPYVRFGVNTLKAYGTPSEVGVTLKQNDIFFLDLGPVWNGYEGDVGSPYVVGNDPEMHRCARDSKALYEIVSRHWRETQVSGRELYDFADQEARKLGWELSLKNANGHRVSDFPHHLYHKGSISDLSFRPSAHIWVLEIQIRHPEREFGAFFEDLLS
jgi:methionyl aminopeptidase